MTRPPQRERIIEKFRSGQIWVLVCTDLMGRGVDFKGVNLVINYDFPQSVVSYIHRIGTVTPPDHTSLEYTSANFSSNY